jgi:hypothetical protein
MLDAGKGGGGGGGVVLLAQFERTFCTHVKAKLGSDVCLSRFVNYSQCHMPERLN